MQVRTFTADEIPPQLASQVQSQTLLGSLPFASLWSQLKGRPVYWVLFDGARAIALLPSVCFGHGPLARLQAMPDGLYANLVALDDRVERLKAGQMILEAIGSSGFAKAFINDYHVQFAEAAGFRTETRRTNVVQLTTEMWQPPDKKLQSEIRKARREEVPIDEFDLDRHFDAFLALMRHTEERHGRSPKYPPSFYEALARLAKTEPRIRWLVCEQDGQLAASHIYLLEGDMLFNWQVFFDKAFSPLKPNQLITYSIASEMAARGVATLNLGASPEHAETLATYKDKWGGEDRHYTCWSRRSWIGRLW